jgi:hypothetical protein
MDLGRPDRDVAAKSAVDEHALGSDGERRGLHQPHVAVDARPFVEPALEAGGIDTNRDDVLSPDSRDVGNVVAKAAVSALMSAYEPSVHKHRGVSEDTVEFQPNAFAGIALRQFEGTAIPTDAVLRKALSHGLEAVQTVGFRIERQLHRPVVRQIDGPPAGVAEVHAGRAVAAAGLG